MKATLERELYFLCSRSAARDGPEWADSLVKVQASPDETMYVAAATPALAERLRGHYALPEVTVIASAKLLAKHHHDFSVHRVLVIGSEAELALFTGQRDTFPFERLAIRY